MNIGAKISSYDFLTMMVSGFIISLLTIGYKENCTASETIVFFIACYIVGMVYHRIVERLFRPTRNMKCCIECAYDDVAAEIKHDFEQKFGRQGILYEYYRAYYLVMKNGCLGNIPVLEAQAAFLRNISILLILCAIAVPYEWGEIKSIFEHIFPTACIGAIVCALLALCLLIIMIHTQRKIHYLVWHAAYYI